MTPLLAVFWLTGCGEDGVGPDPNDEEPEVPALSVRVHPLELPAGTSGRATALSPGGVAVGYVSAGRTPDEAVRWVDGAIDARWRRDSLDLRAQAVNDEELVVGTARRESEGLHCRYGVLLGDDGVDGEDAVTGEGTLTPFTDPEAACTDEITVRDMDLAGRIIGTTTQTHRAYLWHAGELILLETHPPPVSEVPSTPYGISEFGVVVGSVRGQASSYHAPVYWQLDGTVEPFPEGRGRHSFAAGVNPDGLVIMAVGINANDPWLFDLVAMEARDLAEEGVLPEGSRMIAINSSGEIVGRSDPDALSTPPVFFLLSEDEVMYRLEDEAAEWTFDDVVSLDDRGWVLAHARPTPVAEPVPVMLEPRR